MKLPSDPAPFLAPSGVFHTPGTVGQTLNREWGKRGAAWGKTPETLAIARPEWGKVVGQRGASLPHWGQKAWGKTP